MQWWSWVLAVCAGIALTVAFQLGWNITSVYFQRKRQRVGDPYIRDPEHPCNVFYPGEPDEGNDCLGDGHYLCYECAHWKPWEE